MAHNEDALRNKLKYGEVLSGFSLMGRIRRMSWLKNAIRAGLHVVQDITLGGVLKRNTELKGKHAGRRAVVLLPGPSACDIDMALLAPELTICCNYFFLHHGFDKLDPEYFIMVEPFYGALLGKKYVEELTLMFRWMHEGIQHTTADVIVSGSVRGMIRDNGFYPNRKVYYVLPGERLLTAEHPTCDLSRRMSFADGVVFAAIASAMYMGCREIYLVGAGYSYAPAMEGHSYTFAFPADTPSDEVEAQIQALKDAYPVMDFIGHTERNGLIRVTAVTYRDDNFYDQHRVVRRFAEANGVHIVNVVPDGFDSPVYDRLSSDEFIRDVLKAAGR